MNRRSFLRRAGLVGATSVAVASAVKAEEWPDDFTRKGWRIQWSGWRFPANQRVQVGWWSAARADDTSGDFRYFTTGGRYEPDAHKFYSLDMTWLDGWPCLDGSHTPRLAELTKRRALAGLLEKLS